MVSINVQMKFRVPRLSTAAYVTALDDRLGRAIEQAATIWLNSIVLTVIPVWSGASRTTFLKLAREVNFPLSVQGLSTPLISSNPSRWGPRAGFQQSTGEVSKGERAGIYTFTWGTTLFHLVFNEQLDANTNKRAGRVFAQLKQPGPYNLRDIGQAAFTDFSRRVLLPNPWDVARKVTSITKG